MTITLTAMVARLRQDLHDEDAASYRWSDPALQRHVAHALRDYSLVAPLAQKTALAFSVTPRAVDISSLTDLVRVFQVEWPVDRNPPQMVGFSYFGNEVFALTALVPPPGDPVRIYWGKLHTLSDSVQTPPSAHEDLIATGAAAYAALELANYHINLANTGGADVWQRYLDWGQRRWERFQAALKRLSEPGGQVRARTLYVQ